MSNQESTQPENKEKTDKKKKEQDPLSFHV